MSFGTRFSTRGKLWLLTFAVSTLIVTSCKTPTFDLQTPEVINWPERGWRLYSSARTGSGAGSVFGEMRDGTRGEISDLGLGNAEGFDDFVADRTLNKNSVITAGMFARYALKANETGEANVGFTNDSSIEIKVSVRGAKRVTLTDEQLQNALIKTVQISDDDLWQYARYWVRAEVLTATNISFVLNESALRHFGGEAELKSLLSAQGNVSRFITNGNTIIVTSSDRSLNVAYLAKPIKQERLRRLRNIRKESRAKGSESTISNAPVRITSTSQPNALRPNMGNAPEPLRDKFVGRERELRELDQAWESLSSPGPKRTVGVIAWGGFGKTTLVREWLYRKMERDGWPGSESPRVVLWRTLKQRSDLEAFILDAISSFSKNGLVSLAELPTANQRILALRNAIGNHRYVFVLDGLEVFQAQTRGDQLGRAEDQFLEIFLKDHTAGRLGNGMCVVTSRLPVKDLEGAGGTSYFEIPLEERHLTNEEILSLIKIEGIKSCSDDELRDLIQVCGRHPLALRTMASLLVRHKDGLVRRWKELPEVFMPPSDRQEEQQLWRILAWYDALLRPDELSVMKAIAHFREPVPEKWLDILLTGERDKASPTGSRQQAPSVSTAEVLLPGPQLTGPSLRAALRSLTDLKLLLLQDGRYSTHSLVQKHFSDVVAQDDKAKRSYHERLYRFYTGIAQPFFYPETSKEMHPLLESVYHGCSAGLYENAWVTYWSRVSRQTTNFYSRVLGAIESDLNALRPFFAQSWGVTASGVPEHVRADVLNHVTVDLMASCRFREAIQPAIGAQQSSKVLNRWSDASADSGVLSLLYLKMGDLDLAERFGREAVQFSNREDRDGRRRGHSRGQLAMVLRARGKSEESRNTFKEAQEFQSQNVRTPNLGPTFVHDFCELLMDDVERLMWAATLGLAEGPEINVVLSNWITNYKKVFILGAHMKSSAKRWGNFAWLDTKVVGHLAHAKAEMISGIMEESDEKLSIAEYEIAEAFKLLGNDVHDAIRVSARLLRAQLRGLQADEKAALEDLDEAIKIAESGEMHLLIADIELNRARIAGNNYALARAKRLIEEHGYQLRRSELEDAENALNNHGRSNGKSLKTDLPNIAIRIKNLGGLRKPDKVIHADTIDWFVSPFEEDAKSTRLTFIMKLMNLGPTSTTTNWLLTTRLPSGQCYQTRADPPGGTNILRFPDTTALELRPNGYLPEMLSKDSLETGTSIDGWVAFVINGLSIRSIPTKTQFTVSFEDAVGKTISVDNWNTSTAPTTPK